MSWLVLDVFAIWFFSSVITKVQNLEEFRLAVVAYPGASLLGVEALAKGTVLLESLIVLLLLWPAISCRLAGVWLGIFWITLASSAVWLRRLRGEVRFKCGCGLNFDDETSAHALLFRNALLASGLTATLWMTYPPSSSVKHILFFLAAIGLVLGVRLLQSANTTRRRIGQWQTFG